MTAKASDRFIPWYIVVFFLVLTAIYSLFLAIAHDTYPGVVTEKAYDKGLKYNDTIAAAERQEQLGWTGALTADTAADGQAHVTLKLHNAEGGPLAHAKVALWFQRPVKSGMDAEVAMTEVSPGVYEGKAKLAAKGLWEVRAEAQSAGNRFQVSRKVTFR